MTTCHAVAVAEESKLLSFQCWLNVACCVTVITVGNCVGYAPTPFIFVEATAPTAPLPGSAVYALLMLNSFSNVIFTLITVEQKLGYFKGYLNNLSWYIPYHYHKSQKCYFVKSFFFSFFYQKFFVYGLHYWHFYHIPQLCNQTFSRNAS